MSENPQDQDPEVDFEENDIEPQGEVDETEPIDPRFRPAENMPEFNLAALPTGTIPQVIFITRFKWATTTEKKVRELLEPFGPLKSVHMKPKSAFVEFINVEDAHKAKHTLHCRPGLESDSLIVDFKQDNREVKIGRGDRDISRRSRERSGAFPHPRDRERESDRDRDRNRDPRNLVIHGHDLNRNSYHHMRDRNWDLRDTRDRFDRQYRPPSPPHRPPPGYERDSFDHPSVFSHQQPPPPHHHHPHHPPPPPPPQYRRPQSRDRFDSGGHSMGFAHSNQQYPSHVQPNYAPPSLPHSRHGDRNSGPHPMSQHRPPEDYPPYRSDDRYFRSSGPPLPPSSSNPHQYQRQPYPDDRPQRPLHSNQQPPHIPANDGSYSSLNRGSSGQKRSFDQVESQPSRYGPSATGRGGPPIPSYEHQHMHEHQHSSHKPPPPMAPSMHGNPYPSYHSQQDYKRQKY